MKAPFKNSVIAVSTASSVPKSPWDGVVKTTTPFNDTTATFVNDPHYKTKLAKGENASHSYKVTHIQNYRSGRLNGYHSFTSSGKRYRMFFSEELPVTNAFTSEDAAINDLAYDLAVAKLKKRLRKETNNFQLLVPTAELGEMRSLIRQAANMGSEVVGFLLDLKKGRFRNAHKRAADAWLGFNFGVTPVISDVQDLAGSIATALERNSAKRCVSTGKGMHTWSVTDAKSIAQNAPAGYRVAYKYTQSRTYLHRCKFVAGYRVPVISNNDYSMVKHLGLELKNLPSVGWELTPLSWIGDYFSNFGDLLEDTFSSPDIDVIYVDRMDHLDISVRHRIDHSPIYVGLENNVWESIAVNEGNVQKHIFQRTPQGKLPKVRFRFRTSDEIAKHAFSKFLNLSSVLAKTAGRPQRRAGDDLISDLWL